MLVAFYIFFFRDVRKEKKSERERKRERKVEHIKEITRMLRKKMSGWEEEDNLKGKLRRYS